MNHTKVLLLLVGAAITWGPAIPRSANGDDALDESFRLLKLYDWAQDRAVLQPIEAAVTAAHGNADAMQSLQNRLIEIVRADAPRGAKDFACRQLSLIGTKDAVPDVATLLGNAELSHMARYVLERISDDEAAVALRDALPKVEGRLKIGVINSLGARRDPGSVPALSKLLDGKDSEVAAAAAAALGAIGSPEAAKTLNKFYENVPKKLQLAAADACLTCAEHLLADDKKLEAMAIYGKLAKPDQPKHVRLAATRGLLAAAKK